MSLHAEQIDHINIVNWFNYQFPELSDDFHHFANERRCSIQQGRTLKRMGVKRGVADFFLAVSSNGAFGLWLELKTGKNKPSKEQSEFLARKLLRGYDALVVWGFDGAKEAILSYLKDYSAIRYSIDPKKLYNSRPIC